MVALHHRDVHTHVEQLPGEVIGNAAAAHHQHAADFFARQVNGLEKGGNFGGRCRDADVVARLQREVALRDDDLVAALHGAYQHLEAVFAVKRGERQVVQRAALRHGKFAQLHAPLAEGLNFGGRGKGQNACNFLGGRQLGIDRHGQAEVFPHEHELLRVFGIAHARNGVLRAKLVRNKAAQHVAFVGRRGRHQQVGLGHAGLKLYGVADAVAQHRDDVHAGVGIFEIVRVVVNHDNVVPFGGQAFGKGVAHLAVADNDDFHKNNHLKHDEWGKQWGFLQNILQEPSTGSAALFADEVAKRGAPPPKRAGRLEAGGQPCPGKRMCRAGGRGKSKPGERPFSDRPAKQHPLKKE